MPFYSHKHNVPRDRQSNENWEPCRSPPASPLAGFNIIQSNLWILMRQQANTENRFFHLLVYTQPPLSMCAIIITANCENENCVRTSHILEIIFSYRFDRCHPFMHSHSFIHCLCNFVFSTFTLELNGRRFGKCMRACVRASKCI